MTEKVTASFTTSEKRTFIAIAKSKGKRPSTFLRDIALDRILPPSKAK